MASPEASNPLRPYYKPPSIGIQQDTNISRSGISAGLGPKNGSAASYASSARDMFSEIDYSDYLYNDSPSSLDSIQETLNDWFYKYTSTLMGQPFDLAKTILQVRSQAREDGKGSTQGGGRREQIPQHRGAYDDYPSDDSEDEITYFTPPAPTSHSFSSRSIRRNSDKYSSPEISKSPELPGHQLVLKRPDALMEVISQEWAKEGAWGVWKGTNSTFVYILLAKTVENWSRSLIAALVNIPDPGVISSLGGAADTIDTSYPWVSLGVAVSAAVVTGLLLSPLDLVRTKLMLTPVSNPRRSLTQNIRILPSYLCPISLILPTILHSLITPTISHSTPLILRSNLNIDPVLTPSTYSVARLFSRTIELFIKLPLETVLRRGQMAVLATAPYRHEVGDFQTMVKIGPYKGVVGTMWSIAREEGASQEPVSKIPKRGNPVERRGQGIEGLWRGWRVGMWGLVGVWSANALGPSGNGGGEF
ncbi:mitochondrial fusion protein-like protein [Calycina marina]|uniref:Mitochondrial fusion protein-like protein n=1 Tax=Calycina marina TaxID=1763456 RepID=A0A9P7YWA4_9HELO|nr:mitochondrial fusion protein-like protein [Calycina marina]